MSTCLWCGAVIEDFVYRVCVDCELKQQQMADATPPENWYEWDLHDYKDLEDTDE